MELERLTVAIEGDTSGLKKSAKESKDIVNQLDSTKATVEISSSNDSIQKALQLVNELKASMKNKVGAQILDNIIWESKKAGSELEQLKAILDDIKHSPLADFKGIVSTEDTLRIGETIEKLTGYISEAEKATRKLSSTITGTGSVPTPTQNLPKNTSTSNSSGGEKGDRTFSKIFGALLGIRSLFTLVRKIVSQNEAFMAGVNNLFSAVSQMLAPILNFLGALFNSIAGWLSKIFGVNTKTRASTAATSRSLMGFDEINKLDSTRGLGGGSTTDPGKLDWVYDLLNGLVDSIKGAIELIWNIIKLVAASIVVGLRLIVAVVADAIALIVGTITGVVSGITGSIIALIKGIWKTISDVVNDVINLIFGIFTSFVEGYRKARDEGKSVIVAVFEGLWNSIKTTASNLWTLIKDLVTNIWNTVKGVFSAFVECFKTTFMSVWQWTQDKIVTPIMNSIENLWTTFIKPVLDNIANAWSTLKTGFKNMMNGVIGFINNIIYGLNKIPGVNISGISYMASGGFPDIGQLFIARESGPEMVGKIGSQNAVVNNQQIIDGIKQGVMEAMRQANGETNIYVDGEKLFTIVTNRNNSAVMRTGRSPLLV